jgi:phage repressor protein C with HTH and peptisase S24 domain
MLLQVERTVLYAVDGNTTDLPFLSALIDGAIGIFMSSFFAILKNVSMFVGDFVGKDNGYVWYYQVFIHYLTVINIMKHLIERLNLVMKELKLTSNSLAIQANISPSNFRKMLLGEQKITDRTLNLISEKFGINLVWLKTGEGDMLIGNNSMLPNVDIQEGIPYYDVENFECGTPGGFGSALEKTNPDGYFQFPWIKNDGTTFCVKAHGNSMVNIQDPIHSICHGSYIALRRSQVGAIQWGEVYALATADGYIVKKLMPSDVEGCVKCVSFNDEEYPAFELAADEVYDYAKVVGVATINLW